MYKYYLDFIILMHEIPKTVMWEQNIRLAFVAKITSIVAQIHIHMYMFIAAIPPSVEIKESRQISHKLRGYSRVLLELLGFQVFMVYIL